MKTLTDMFKEHIGAKEYDSFVRKMITWYYGKFAEVAWCAISMSWMASQLGILDQFGGKNQNCYEMLRSVKAAGKGKLRMREELKPGELIKRGAVIFLLRDNNPPMKFTSKKHVTTVYKDFKFDKYKTFDSLGGNQDDEIKIKPYAQSQIYAVFDPEYETTVKRGDKGEKVAELQNDLNQLGYPDDDYNALKIDGKFGAKTEQALKNFQRHNGLKEDGVCGEKTWGRIEQELSAKKKQVISLRTLIVHKKPSSNSPGKGKLKKGTIVEWSYMENKWLYLPRWNGWISSLSSYTKSV